MPALRKCSFFPLDKWPAEPLFWVEAACWMKVQAACWMKVKSCTNPKKKLLDILKQGILRNSSKVGNCKVEVSVGGIPGDFWRIFGLDLVIFGLVFERFFWVPFLSSIFDPFFGECCLR
jgi:hypothetical protein